ncbi:putative RNA-directed DNA polymerase [Tanacetum coccineum]
MEEVDYHDTFAPIAKLATIRTLLAVVVKKEWVIYQLDVNNAFLHGDLNEEVYLKLPQGFAKENDMRVYYSLFIFKKNACFVAALIYVYDVIMVGNDVMKIQHTKEELDKRFSIKDLGALKYFLGIEVSRIPEGLVLSQRKYILDILEDCGFQGCRPSPFPFKQNLILDQRDKEPKVNAGRYHRLTRDIVIWMQHTKCYGTKMEQLDKELFYHEMVVAPLPHSVILIGLAVVLPRDLGWDIFSFFEEYPFHVKTKKQNVVSRSSTDVEYRSMTSTVSEILWMRWLLKELNINLSEPTPLFCDNQAARHIANNPVFHERTKHVEMDCYFVRERVESQEIQPLRIHTSIQIADLLTKGLGPQQLKFLLDKLGVRNLHAPT